jgi:hypothetical protein
LDWFQRSIGLWFRLGGLIFRLRIFWSFKHNLGILTTRSLAKYRSDESPRRILFGRLG